MPEGIGEAPRRREDARFLTGQGGYLDDLAIPDLAHAVLLRSPHAHAAITGIDTAAARAAPGVLAVLTASEAHADGLRPLPPVAGANPYDGTPFAFLPQPLLAEDKVRHVGEPVALVRQPLLFSDADPVQGHLLGVLRKTLALIDLVSLDDGVVPAMVRLDDLMLRLLALLVYPKLLAGSTAVELEVAGPQAEAVLDALIDTMRVDLAHPWGLSDLERASGLSRPQLDQVFRARFSCSPLQWLRRQRLCWARQVLERPGNRLGLWDLAQLCGYRSLEEFRREFQESFLLTPDRLLELAQRRDAEE